MFMNYIKDSKNYTLIPVGYHQKFFHSPQVTTIKPVIVNFITSENINSEDVALVKFLYNVTFATKKQLEMYCSYAGIEYLQPRLDFMFSNNIINKFGFTDEENYKGELPSDALVVYCLSEGGKQLLEHADDDSDFINWNSSYAIRNSKFIGKCLINTEFYLSMLTVRKLKFNSFEARPVFTIKADTFYALSVYCLRDAKNPFYFIVDSFRSSDNIMLLREKLRKYESFLGTNFWKKFFPDSSAAPLLFLFADTDDMCKTLSDELKVLKIKHVRLSTDERLLRGISDPHAFLKYNPDYDRLDECQIPIFT